jgi:hypothetical protein
MLSINPSTSFATVPHHSNHPQHHPQPTRTPLHKDWRSWAVVILMLAAMAIYLLTMDESLGPGGQPQPAIDAGDAE